jgi:ribulose-5-phosphate 4-epimerase/fuculose-1-phosphate aldolase
LEIFPWIESATPRSIELATKVKDAFKNLKIKAVRIKEHGVVAIGESLESDYHTTSLVEDTTKIALLSSLIEK